jgi:hypothetical protein
MSDMSRELTSFTVRELSRETAHVLEVCAREGAVSIRTRNGESFKVAAEKKLAKAKRSKAEGRLHPIAQHWVNRRKKMRAMRKELGLLPLDQEQMDKLGQMIAGE